MNAKKRTWYERQQGAAQQPSTTSSTQSHRLLHAARIFAAQGEPCRLIDQLVQEAVALVDGDDAMVTVNDEVQRPLRGYSGCRDGSPILELPQIASIQALERREPVILDDRRPGACECSEGDRRTGTVLAIPLLHEECLLGALVVQAYSPGRRLNAEDAALLQTLGSIASAALIGIQQAGLRAIALAARTMQHEVMNKLTLTCGWVELISQERSLPPHVYHAASRALEGAEEVARIVNRLQELREVRTRSWGSGIERTLDLRESVASTCAVCADK